jgi:hypothetical protein
MTIHGEPHPLAGKKVQLRAGVSDPERGMVTAGAEFEVQDWWDRVSGKSWTKCPGDTAVFQYGMRIFSLGTIALDDEVVYGKIGPYGHLVHNTELPGEPE